MSEEFTKLRIILPPEGSLMRDLILTTLPILTDSEGFRKLEYSKSLNEIFLFFINKYAIEEAFETLFDTTLRVIERKRKAGVRDRGLHRNDAQWISKIVNYQEGYLAAAKALIEFFRSNFDPTYLSIRSVRGYKEVYGCPNGETYALIQPLKIENYEYGSEWLKGIGGGIKSEIRLDLNYYILLMSGYALSYAGIMDSEMIFLCPEESWIIENIIRGKYLWLPYEKILGKFSTFLYESKDNKGIITRIACLRIPLEPKHAYLIYIASDLASAFKERKVILKTLRLCFTRIAGGGRTFTLLERSKADLASLIAKITRLYKYSEEAISCLKKISKKALLFRRYNLSLYGDYCRFISHFYEYLHQAYDPFFLIYEAARGHVGTHESCLKELLRAIIKVEHGVMT